MIGVTIGIGDDWEPLAKTAATRMSALTGLDCVVINDWHGPELEHAAWMKCRILDLFPKEDSFLYFDADVWCLKQWNPAGLFELYSRHFLAVPEPFHSAIVEEHKKFNLPDNHHYFNAGLMLFGREDGRVFSEAAKMQKDEPRWYDQTPLNIAVSSFGCGENLPHRYNALAHAGVYHPEKTNTPLAEVINLHWCSSGASKVKALQSL